MFTPSRKRRNQKLKSQISNPTLAKPIMFPLIDPSTVTTDISTNHGKYSGSEQIAALAWLHNFQSPSTNQSKYKFHVAKPRLSPLEYTRLFLLSYAEAERSGVPCELPRPAKVWCWTPGWEKFLIIPKVPVNIKDRQSSTSQQAREVDSVSKENTRSSEKFGSKSTDCPRLSLHLGAFTGLLPSVTDLSSLNSVSTSMNVESQEPDRQGRRISQSKERPSLRSSLRHSHELASLSEVYDNVSMCSNHDTAIYNNEKSHQSQPNSRMNVAETTPTLPCASPLLAQSSILDQVSDAKEGATAIEPGTPMAHFPLGQESRAGNPTLCAARLQYSMLPKGSIQETHSQKPNLQHNQIANRIESVLALVTGERDADDPDKSNILPPSLRPRSFADKAALTSKPDVFLFSDTGHRVSERSELACAEQGNRLQREMSPATSVGHNRGRTRHLSLESTDTLIRDFAMSPFSERSTQPSSSILKQNAADMSPSIDSCHRHRRRRRRSSSTPIPDSPTLGRGNEDICCVKPHLKGTISISLDSELQDSGLNHIDTKGSLHTIVGVFEQPKEAENYDTNVILNEDGKAEACTILSKVKQDQVSRDRRHVYKSAQRQVSAPLVTWRSREKRRQVSDTSTTSSTPISTVLHKFDTTSRLASAMKVGIVSTPEESTHPTSKFTSIFRRQRQTSFRDT